MKKPKSAGTRMSMRAKFSKITSRYWYSVVNLLTAFAFVFVADPRGVGAKRWTEAGFGEARCAANADTASAGSFRPRRIGTNDSLAKTH